MRKGRTHLSFKSGFEVLLDALSVEDMMALGLNRVFRKLVAQATDCAFTFVWDIGGRIGLATDDEIRMASHLPHAGQQTEDVRVV